jgi:fatty acid desaturase
MNPVATSQAPQPAPLVPLRSALIALIAVVIGCALGGLTFWATHSWPQALLAGLLGAGATLLPLDKIIGR